MTTAIAIRDELRARLPIIRPIADIVTSYAVCRGDLLLYTQVAFPDSADDDLPLWFFPTALEVGVWIDPDDGTLTLINNDDKFWVALDGQDDPLADVIAQNRAAYGGDYGWLRECIQEIRDHIEGTVAACLAHLLSGP